MAFDCGKLDKRKWLISFGRTRGKNFKQKKLAQLDRYLFNNFNLEDLNLEKNLYHLEIGFGGGEHLLYKAQLNHNIKYIGCEVYLNGIGHVLQQITASSIQNISIWPYDARVMLEKLPENVISKTYILFPDPWPKKRTKKRRLINEQFLSLLIAKMKEKSEIVIASDSLDYIQWIEGILLNLNLHYIKEQPACMYNIETKYQAKSITEVNWLSIKL